MLRHWDSLMSCIITRYKTISTLGKLILLKKQTENKWNCQYGDSVATTFSCLLLSETCSPTWCVSRSTSPSLTWWALVKLLSSLFLRSSGRKHQKIDHLNWTSVQVAQIQASFFYGYCSSEGQFIITKSFAISTFFINILIN